MFNEVYELIDNIFWRKLFKINYSSYVELCREFYATFKYSYDVKNLNLNIPLVYFWLRGKLVHCSITNFNLDLGVYDTKYVKAATYLNSLCDYPTN